MRAAFDDVRLAEMEDHIQVVRIEIVRARKCLTGAGHVALVIQHGEAGIEIALRSFCDGAGGCKHLGGFEPHVSGAVRQRSDVLQHGECCGRVIADEVLARLCKGSAHLAGVAIPPR